MSYSVKKINRETAIKTANQWIMEWGKVPIRTGMYGNIALALLDENKQIVYLGFIWESPTEMAMIGFVTRNKNIRVTDKSIRRKFIEELILHVKKLGYRYVASWVADAGLKKDLRDIGCTETSNSVSEFFAEIKIE